MIKKVQSYFSELIPNGIIFLRTSAVAKNATALYVIQIAEYIIPMITIPVVVKAIGADGFGQAAFCQGLVAYLTMFVDYGFSMSATRSVSVYREDKAKIRKIFSSTIIAKFMLFIVGLATLLLLSLLSPKIHDNLIMMLVVYMGVLGNIIQPIWLFQGMEKMSFLSIASISAKVFMIVGIFLFVSGDNSVVIYLFILSLTQILYGLITFLKAKRQFAVSIEKVRVADIGSVLREGWVLFLSNASVSLYTAGNPFILGFFVSPAIVGYYSAAERIAKAGLGLIGPISQAVYPRFAKLVNESREQFYSLVKKVFYTIGGFGLILSLLIYLFAPFAVKILLGPDFGYSVGLIRVLSPLPFIISLSTVFGTQIMLPLGKDKDFTKILFVAGVINFGLVFLLAGRIGAYASAIALVAAEVYVSLTMFFFVKDKIRNVE